MTLATLWEKNRDQIADKKVWQVIKFAGDGKLRDDNVTSQEFREFLTRIPSKKLEQYADECLEEKFEDNGFVLQDVVNQLGKRLSFTVIDGRYRGTRNQVGYDGIWKFPNGHTVIVEVKTTDLYEVKLETIAAYRRSIISSGQVTDQDSSILIVIGRGDRDTASLESQIRGSRYAWDIRIISVEALIRLMTLKETVDDPRIISRISSLLIPKEFTKLDEIIDLVFSTAEDVRVESFDELKEDEKGELKERAKPLSFNDACISRIEKHFGVSLVKQSRTTYSLGDSQIRISCAISKEYQRTPVYYWYAFHPHQKDFLLGATDAYVSFGCGSPSTVLFIPFGEFVIWLDSLNTTDADNRFYWHVIISREGNELYLSPKKGFPKVKLTGYLLPS
jgi:hypothetical protein